MFRGPCYFSIFLVSLVGLVGCAPSGVEVVSETDEKQYQLGQDYKNQGRMEEALGAFERVIDARRDAPESHLEAGYIYLRTLKDRSMRSTILTATLDCSRILHKRRR